MICPAGRSAGSLQVVAGSPARAAGLPPMKTVALPWRTVPRSAGGFWNGPPWGMWAGVLVAVEPTTAAGLPSMLTSLASEPSSVPTNGCGRGVGTGPPGDGIITMCVSVAITLSPCFAAGLPMVPSLPSIEIDRPAFEIEGRVGVELDLLRLHLDGVGLEGELPLGLQLHGAVAVDGDRRLAAADVDLDHRIVVLQAQLEPLAEAEEELPPVAARDLQMDGVGVLGSQRQVEDRLAVGVPGRPRLVAVDAAGDHRGVDVAADELHQDEVAHRRHAHRAQAAGGQRHLAQHQPRVAQHHGAGVVVRVGVAGVGVLLLDYGELHRALPPQLLAHDALQGLEEGGGHSSPPRRPARPPPPAALTKWMRVVNPALFDKAWRTRSTRKLPFRASRGAPETSTVAPGVTSGEPGTSSRPVSVQASAAAKAALAAPFAASALRRAGSERTRPGVPAVPATAAGSFTSQLQASDPWLPAAPSPTMRRPAASGAACVTSRARTSTP